MFSSLIDWLKNIGIVQLLLGALLGISFDSYIKRPKLIVKSTGGGGGPGPGYYQNSIQIANDPGLLGVKIPGTTIFGKRIHGYIERGLVFERIAAHDCRAILIDKKTGEHLGSLWWRINNSPSHFVQMVNLNSGEEAELIIFARLNEEPSKYFVYEPQNGDTNNPKTPNEESKFNETREFIIEVRFFYGKKKIRIGMEITKSFDGRLSYKVQGGGGTF